MSDGQAERVRIDLDCAGRDAVEGRVGVDVEPACIQVHEPACGEVHIDADLRSCADGWRRARFPEVP